MKLYRFFSVLASRFKLLPLVMMGGSSRGINPSLTLVHVIYCDIVDWTMTSTPHLVDCRQTDSTKDAIVLLIPSRFQQRKSDTSSDKIGKLDAPTGIRACVSPALMVSVVPSDYRGAANTAPKKSPQQGADEKDHAGT